MEQDVEMTVDNIDCSIVGEGRGWEKLTKDQLKPIVAAINAEAPAPMEVEDVDGGDGGAPPAAGAAAPAGGDGA